MIEIMKLMEGVEAVPHFERYGEEELTALYAFWILQYCHEVQAKRYHIQKLIDQTYDDDAISHAPVLRDAGPLDLRPGYVSYSPYIESALGHVAKAFLAYSLPTGELRGDISEPVLEQEIADIVIQVDELKMMTYHTSDGRRANPLNISGGIFLLNKRIREIHRVMIAPIQEYLESMVCPEEAFPHYPTEPIRKLLCLSANTLHCWHMQLDNIQTYLEKDAKLSLR